MPQTRRKPPLSAAQEWPADKVERRRVSALVPYANNARTHSDEQVAQIAASLPGVGDKDTAWRFVQRYAPGTAPDTDPELDTLIGLAVNYARDFVAPTLQRRAPSDTERAALTDLDAELTKLAPDTPADEIQHLVFEIGKRHAFDPLRDWFKTLYETLLGSSQGPRMGSFIALYGIDNSRKLIAEALAGAAD